MQQFFWEANSHSAGQEIPCLLWNKSYSQKLVSGAQCLYGLFRRESRNKVLLTQYCYDSCKDVSRAWQNSDRISEPLAVTELCYEDRYTKQKYGKSQHLYQRRREKKRLVIKPPPLLEMWVNPWTSFMFQKNPLFKFSCHCYSWFAVFGKVHIITHPDLNHLKLWCNCKLVVEHVAWFMVPIM